MDELTREGRSGERKRADAHDFAARLTRGMAYLSTPHPGAPPFPDSFWRATFEPRIEWALPPEPGVYRSEAGGYLVMNAPGLSPRWRLVGVPGGRWTRIADDPAHVQAVQ